MCTGNVTIFKKQGRSYGARYEGFTDFDTLYLALKYANHREYGIAGSGAKASMTADRLNRIES